MKKIAIIGGGFSGLSAAAMLGKEGHEVHIFEKNNQIGGRARQVKMGNYKFDLGPSWYWMPDVYERFFSEFGHISQDFYELKKLEPSFSIVYGKDEVQHIPANFDELCVMFENIEPGAAKKLQLFMKNAEFKYNVGVKKLIYKPALSLFEFFDIEIITGVFKLTLLSSFAKYLRKYFKNPRLLALMEFPVLFLGAIPENTPALYSLMNYSGLKIGTYYPMGGFSTIIDAMSHIALTYNVTTHTNSAVKKIHVANKKVYALDINSHGRDYSTHQFDVVLGTADYQHIDQELLEKPIYSKEYWDTRVFAPSALIFHIALDTTVPKLEHHTLFFEHPLTPHVEEIYTTKQWPENPLFYVCCPSKTDNTLAPMGHDILYVLMPIAIGLEDTPKMRDKYYTLLINRLEAHIGITLSQHITHQFSYCLDNFKQDYNAFKGNAYGLANTLNQTAILKPKLQHNHINNLFFAGQLTTPGPGVPPAIVSGQVAAQQIIKYCNKTL